MEITPGVHHFTDHRFNWYVVEEGGRLTVIDTGFPGHYRLLLAGLASIGREVGDVEGIVITHAHADHTGFASRLAAASGAPIHVHPLDAALVARPLYLPWPGLLGHAWRPYTAAMLGHAVGQGLLRLPRIRASRPVRDGEVLDLPGRPRIIHLPGHTPGDLVVHLPDRQVLLSGDALVTRDLFTGRDTAPQVTGPGLDVDPGRAVRELRRLDDLGVLTLLPGHGRPWTGDLAAATATATATATAAATAGRPIAPR